MSVLPYQREAQGFAKGLATQAVWPFAFIVILYVYMPPVQSLQLEGPAKIIFFGAMAAGCIAVLLSFYLLFDAALFLHMSRYPDEDSGGAAVDALLARMRLRSLPQRTRTLRERIDGTSRLLPLHRTALGASIASTATFLFLAGTQGQ